MYWGDELVAIYNEAYIGEQLEIPPAVRPANSS